MTLTPTTATLREGAAILAGKAPGITFDELRGMVSEWMRAEALLLESFPPLVDLFNVRIESRTGVASYLKLSQAEDGDLLTRSDTIGHGAAIAQICHEKGAAE